MQINKHVIIKELVSENYRAADVFYRHGIDFCCGGHISLAEACQREGLETERVLRELEMAMKENDHESDLLNRLPLDDLCRFITETHHTFVRNNLHPISDYLIRIVMAHGDSHPELEAVQEHFQSCSKALVAHMQKEETILFPYISSMVEASRIGRIPNPPAFGSVASPIAAMEADHAIEGQRFKDIQRLTHQYTVPTDGCNTYKVAFEKLKAFEQDLHRHIHLENNVLFPKALQLESSLYPS